MDNNKLTVDHSDLVTRWQLVTLEFEDGKEHPEKAFTNNLEKIGLIRLQKNIFVCPYECISAVNFISASCGAQEFTKIITFEDVEELKTYLWNYYETEFSKSFVNKTKPEFDIL